jgi:hypothetical protein
MEEFLALFIARLLVLVAERLFHNTIGASLAR